MGGEPENILATSYLPPTGYIEKIIGREEIIIEACEHFVKQTIRNRCHILSPNGIQTLIVPIVHTNRFRVPIKDLKISNDTPWQRLHWRSLNMAYRRSAFFEFYMDDLAPFYEKKFDFLLDFNTRLLEFVMQSLRLKCEINFTTEYAEPEGNDGDYRTLCNTGNPDLPSKTLKYPQVFGYKSGFVEGLSIVDLLFNAGKEEIDH